MLTKAEVARLQAQLTEAEAKEKAERAKAAVEAETVAQMAAKKVAEAVAAEKAAAAAEKASARMALDALEKRGLELGASLAQKDELLKAALAEAKEARRHSKASAAAVRSLEQSDEVLRGELECAKHELAAALAVASSQSERPADAEEIRAAELQLANMQTRVAEMRARAESAEEARERAETALASEAKSWRLAMEEKEVNARRMAGEQAAKMLILEEETVRQRAGAQLSNQRILGLEDALALERRTSRAMSVLLEQRLDGCAAQGGDMAEGAVELAVLMHRADALGHLLHSSHAVESQAFELLCEALLAREPESTLAEADARMAPLRNAHAALERAREHERDGLLGQLARANERCAELQRRLALSGRSERSKCLHVGTQPSAGQAQRALSSAEYAANAPTPRGRGPAKTMTTVRGSFCSHAV